MIIDDFDDPVEQDLIRQLNEHRAQREAAARYDDYNYDMAREQDDLEDYSARQTMERYHQFYEMH